MSEYLAVFSSYLNVFSIIWSCIKYTALGLVVIILIFLLFRKKIFIPRQNILLKSLSYSYILVIPVLILSFSVAYSLISATHNDIVEKIPRYEQDVQYVIDNYLSDDIAVMIDADVTLDSALDMIMPAIKTSIHSQLSLAESAEDTWSEFVLTALDSPYATKIIKNKLQTVIAEYTSMDKLSVEEIFTLTPRQLINGEAITKVMIHQVSSFFTSIKTKILWIWGVVSLLILIEIIVANYNHCKRTQVLDE